MAEQRKYGEDEVREIFALATHDEGGRLPAPGEDDGLTLEEVQAVGGEVGIAPERVAEAAAALDARPTRLPSRTWLGAPVSVGRVVELPRAATEREWQFLVAELRDTFGAKGRVRSEGSVREWSNGNLHAVLEETETGHRLRLGTRKGNAAEASIVGWTFLATGLFLLIAILAKGKMDALFLPLVFGGGGAGTLVWNRLRLPAWAGERERQMEHIATRARELLRGPPQD